MVNILLQNFRGPVAQKFRKKRTPTIKVSVLRQNFPYFVFVVASSACKGTTCPQTSLLLLSFSRKAFGLSTSLFILTP